MKILLLGDFSSFHKYLKHGLVNLGHEVTLASRGDGWKKISGYDVQLYTLEGKNKVTRFIDGYKSANKSLKEFRDYDVVQLINPWIYNRIYNYQLLKEIKSHNNLISLVSAGIDLALFEAYKSGAFEYFLFDYNKTFEKRYSNSTISGRNYRKIEQNVVNLCDIIIPSIYEYSVGYKNNPKVHDVIPMPIDVEDFTYSENIVNGPVVIFHGVNREADKGTPFIREALKRIKAKYGDSVEIIIDGHMPFDKYVSVMSRANIIIDECCSYGYGINADIALAQGKVVLSPARDETLNAYHISRTDCPLFSLSPNVDQIEKTIAFVLDNKDKIPFWGRKSREFVKKFHDCTKVAQMYVDAWKTTGKV